jgi:hypothetical protein
MIEMKPAELTLFAWNAIRLVNHMTDGELEDAIKRLNLVEEFLENFNEAENRDAFDLIGAFTKRPEGARNLARLMVSTTFCIYPGAKKYLRLSRERLHIFALDFQTRQTEAAKLVWDLRLKHGI